LIDGEGLGDDRRLNLLLKGFIKFCNNPIENMDLFCDKLLFQLTQTEFGITKSELAEKMIREELENYEKISKAIEETIETVKRQIVTYKEGLVVAKKIRQNKMEYDVLAKVINQQPDRIQTTHQFEKLNAELSELYDKQLQLNKKLEQKRKEFAVLMNALNELEELSNNTIADNSSEASDIEILEEELNKMSDDEVV
jgi:THO complex subunit 7